ncbi:O-linked N-acetylglucosamine transferase family protein [Paraburkholderia fungorum]|uniref:O-linked N-acetylglucosamine transferase family protein n=1 Tax=Paraburkholderia fungorum TaxID=134537 RepID=UPI0038BBB400
MRVAAEYPLDALHALHLTRPTQLDERDQAGAVAIAAAEGAPSGALTPAQVAALADEFIATLAALRELGQHEQAEAVARQMTMMVPEHAYGWQALGSALLQQGRADAARGPLERADELLPAAARPVPTADEQKQVVALYKSGRTTEAATMAQGLTERYTHHALGWRVLGLARAAEAQFDEAIDPLRRARESDPHDFDVILTLADVLRHQGRAAEAEREARHLTELAPERIEGYCVLGLALQLQERNDEAEVIVRRALEIAPGDTRVLATLASILLRLGRLAEARDICDRALKIDPGMTAVRSNLLFAMTHDEAVDDQALLAQHRLFGKLVEDKLRVYRKPHPNLREPQRCLRVGFVSGDLYAHAVASFLAPVLHYLAREPGLTLHAYYNNTVDDSVSQQLRAQFASWTPVAHMSDAALDEKIRADRIDILIDLSGHTGLNRLPVFARKPAPIQASWIGYPATTGMRTMDYYFADRFFVPPGEPENQFVENIVHLPASAPFVPADVAPPINRLPALANGYVTFGSFNRMSKLRPAVIKLWAQLLHAVPTARMLIGGVPEDGYNKLVDWFEQEGIDRTRLESRPRLQMRVYLQQHHAVDICLDAFPYAGGTTTLHAAWMGVPTLTLPGGSAASRGGAAIVSHLALEGFIASDPADFIEKGVDWANNLSTLAELRANMRERCARSAYFQPGVVAEGMSRALRLMWQRWTEGKPPVAFDPGQEVL